TWQTLNLDNFVLDAGPHLIRLLLDSAGPDYVANFNWLQATLTLSNNPQTVSLTAPPDKATFAAAENITLSANAADLDGSISKVDFFANGFSLGTSTIPPYGIAWTNPTAGNYLLTARATDTIGNATVSPVRTINVINGEAPFAGLPQT